MIAFRITIDGRHTYVGLYCSSWDAIEDGFDRGARSVAVTRA